MLITRKAEFCASHVCRNPSLSDAENERLFGKAANPQGHGHNYVLEVTLEGEPDSVTGMIFDLRELKELLNRQVIEPFDHRFLNRETPPFDRIVPTTENLAIEIWKRLELSFVDSRAKLHSVRLYETADLFVDYIGESS